MFRFGFSKASFLLYPAWIRCFSVFEDMDLRNCFHCKSPALRTFLLCAFGMWELPRRINFIEASRSAPRCVQATNSVLFPRENAYSFSRSCKDGKSRAEQAGDSPWHQRGPTAGVLNTLQTQPGWGHPWVMSPVSSSPVTCVVLGNGRSGVWLSPWPSASSFASLGNSRKDSGFFLLCIFSKWLNILDANCNCGTEKAEISLHGNSNCFLFNGDKPD